MASIPKKVLQRFSTEIPKFQKVLQVAKDRDVNESDTVAIITDILSAVFGYDKYLEITSEFLIRGTYCDLAIKLDDKIQFLIEAKAIGLDLKDNHIRQAIDYGANHGIQWVLLTNGLEWRLYSIRFEKPIDYDLVANFQFLSISPKLEKDQELVFMLAKEGLTRKAREEYYEKVKCVNRYTLSHLILSEPTINLLRRELRRFADGIKVDASEIDKILRNEVFKRDLFETEEAKAVAAKVCKMYKKKNRSPKILPEIPADSKSECEGQDRSRSADSEAAQR